MTTAALVLLFPALALVMYVVIKHEQPTRLGPFSIRLRAD